MPPFFWASATVCSASVVLPDDFPARRSRPPAPSAGRRRRAQCRARASRGDRLDVHRAVVLAELHHRALAELTFDLGQRGGQSLTLVHGGSFDDTQRRGGHGSSLWRGFAEWTNACRPIADVVRCQNYVHHLFHVRNMFFLGSGSGLHLTHVISVQLRIALISSSGIFGQVNDCLKCSPYKYGDLELATFSGIVKRCGRGGRSATPAKMLVRRSRPNQDFPLRGMRDGGRRRVHGV